ncbi:MAG: hypothetical protein ACRC1I_03935 [Pseudomonas proteolytica]|uniref:hypothetical protein n=1 Tax=Pseudomonas proteolytica TaxID=219574 RepID=UPI003F378D92
MSFPERLEQLLPPFVDPFISAISLIEPGDDRHPPGDHHGTGSFIYLDEVRLMLTCEHVASVEQGTMLGMTQFGASHAISIPGAFSSDKYPIDIAVNHIPDKNWDRVPHMAKCVDIGMIARRHEPVDGEYLYIYGFPGDDAAVGFGQHHHRGLAVFSHERDFSTVLIDEEPKPIDKYHFLIPYNPEHAVLLDGKNPLLPKPPGMSGSLVWNTRYVEVTSQGKEWRPEDSRVTGVVWGHSSKASVLVATKIEFLRYFLSVDNDLDG